MQPAFEIQTDVYSGPFPVLLELIEKKKLSVSSLSLAEITDDYIAYVRTLADLNVDDLSQFILIAATLMLIKSKALVPQFELEKEEQADVALLEQRLLTFEVVKGATGLLKDVFKKGVYLWKRPTVKTKKIQFSPQGLSTQSLLEQVESIIYALPKVHTLPETRVKSTLSLETVITNLMNRVKNAQKVTWSELSSGAHMAGDRKEVKQFMIVTFLALLELVRSGSYDSEQEGEYGEIVLTTSQHT